MAIFWAFLPVVRETEIVGRQDAMVAGIFRRLKSDRYEGTVHHGSGGAFRRSIRSWAWPRRIDGGKGIRKCGIGMRSAHSGGREWVGEEFVSASFRGETRWFRPKLCTYIAVLKSWAGALIPLESWRNSSGSGVGDDLFSRRSIQVSFPDLNPDRLDLGLRRDLSLLLSQPHQSEVIPHATPLRDEDEKFRFDKGHQETYSQG
jgi:hypothetical protein